MDVGLHQKPTFLKDAVECSRPSLKPSESVLVEDTHTRALSGVAPFPRSRESSENSSENVALAKKTARLFGALASFVTGCFAASYDIIALYGYG